LDAPKILVSAGEASGDLYAALVVEELRRSQVAATEFFGCTGPRLRAAGVRTVVDAASLAVVGLLEVVEHIPRIYGEYRKLLAAAEKERPDWRFSRIRRIFTCGWPGGCTGRAFRWSYLVAPQAWAWRKGRLRDAPNPAARALHLSL
jgi:lipid-A-disaccharide synthase